MKALDALVFRAPLPASMHKPDRPGFTWPFPSEPQIIGYADGDFAVAHVTGTTKDLLEAANTLPYLKALVDALEQGTSAWPVLRDLEKHLSKNAKEPSP